ncbi:MAG: 5' nucleotidase, NT5C type [Thermodesulfobacteriota bacterium]
MTAAFLPGTETMGKTSPNPSVRIRPGHIAFDIDGVIADTMSLFIEIARSDYRIDWIRYEEITSYSLEEVEGIDASVAGAIIQKLLDGNYDAPLLPIQDAPEVLSRIGRVRTPLLFVTARPYPGPMAAWLAETASLEPAAVEIVATGSFEAKTTVLLERGITHFVEDRLETCYGLQAAGITPILFKQPWNRRQHDFIEVGSWRQLENMIDFE